MSDKRKNHQDSFDLQYIIAMIRKNWLYIGAVAFFALCLSYLYNKTQVPVYKINSALLIKSDENSPAQASAQFMDGFGLFASEKNFQNELQVIKSSPLIREAIQNLNFTVSYYHHTRLKTIELYKSSPFVVVFNQNHPQPINTRIHIEVKDESSFEYHIDKEEVTLYSFASNNVIQKLPKLETEGYGAFGETVESDNFEFKVIFNDNFSIQDYKTNDFSFIIHDPKSLVKSYQGALEVIPLDVESSVARIGIESAAPGKAIDFVNSLLNTYLNYDLDKKNHMSTKTVEYIDNQLNVIKDSLKIAEENLQRFRTRHDVMDISVKSGRVFDQLQELEREKADLLVNAQYYDYIDDYFEKNSEFNDLIAPSAMGIDDQLLNNMIQELIQLNAEKVSLIENNQEKSPYLRKLNIRIDNLRNTISENIKYIINTTDIAINDIDTRLNKLNQEIKKLPKTERELFGIERQFNLNDAIYTYLLEKRAEAQIAKASYLPDAEIIEQADIAGDAPISPKKKQNYLIALFFGTFLPLIFIRIKDMVNNKVGDKTDIQKMVSTPILGQIYENTKKVDVVIKAFPRSHIAESFRMLRTSLNYFLPKKGTPTIVVTSTHGQEGKSFITTNLAASLATAKNKTIVLGFDLRKPKIFQRLNIHNNIGISNYLIEEAGLDDIIQATNIENLDVITAGDIPPNPAELIASNKTAELINLLKERYDYVLIDTPPIGIISDAFALMDLADLNVYVVRQNQSPKREMLAMIDELETKKFKNLCMVINDIPVKKKTKQGYGYYE